MNIVVDQGQPLYMEWTWENAPTDAPVDPIQSKMTLSIDGNIEHTLILSGGLGISGLNGLAKVQCDIVNTERLNAGTYDYHIKIVDSNGGVEIEDSGTITIVEKDVPENNYAPRPWDYFYARLTEEVPQEKVAERISICQTCEFFKDGICEKNFANIELFAGEQASFCPIYKW